MVKPIRVFLVDDHPLVREGIRRLLESEEGIVVVGETGSAEESLENLGAQSVDVVLMDIKLTGMNGIEAMRRLRVERPDLKVVMLSSFGSEYVVQAIEAGAEYGVDGQDFDSVDPKKKTVVVVDLDAERS